MVRWFGVTLLMGCFAAQMLAQVSKEQESAVQTPAAEPASVEPTSATPATKSQFPLDAFTDFSAVMVGSAMEAGEGTAEAYIYRAGKLLRMEGPEGHGYYITDLTTLETFGVSAANCMHDKHPFFRASPFAASVPGAKVERVAAGKETVDGHSCQVEDVTILSPKPGAVPLRMRLWEAEDMQGFPIKIQVQRGRGHATIRYKNVVIGPQDPSLFIHPNSCGALPQKTPPPTPKAAPATKNPATTPPAK